MRWLCYSLFTFFLWAAQSRKTGATESPLERASLVNPSDGKVILHEDRIKDVKNDTFRRETPFRKETFTDLNSFLLFPVLSFLLPDMTKSGDSNKAKTINDTELRNDPGPVVFFEQIPLENETRLPKVTEDKEPTLPFFGNLTRKPQSSRDEKKKRKTAEFFPSFLGDGFSQPGSLLADIPFLRKSERNPKKLQDKHQDPRNELKFIQNAFDEAYLETEKGFKEADPFAKLFQIVDGFFSGNAKREEKAGTKEKTASNGPAIILDEMVEIGQVHVFDDGTHRDQRKGKRGAPRKSSNAYHRNRHERNTKKTHENADHTRRESFQNNSSSQNNNTYIRERKHSRKAVHPKSLREDLTRNITEVLNRFLNQREEFDWTERETLERHEGSRGKRQHKTEDFEEEHVGTEKKERQVADLNFLFLAITLPTVFVLALLLLACFSSFRVKGKICTKMFKSRQAFVVDGGSPRPGADDIKSRPRKTQNV